MDTNDGCPSGYYDLDHVVTLVGYGMETVTETIGGTTSTTCRRRTRAEKKQGCPGGSFRSGNNCCTSTTTEGQTVTTEKDYFLVQNQWGTGWGDQGFIKMAATGGNGVCGMNLENLYIELE